LNNTPLINIVYEFFPSEESAGRPSLSAIPSHINCSQFNQQVQPSRISTSPADHPFRASHFPPVHATAECAPNDPPAYISLQPKYVSELHPIPYSILDPSSPRSSLYGSSGSLGLTLILALVRSDSFCSVLVVVCRGRGRSWSVVVGRGRGRAGSAMILFGRGRPWSWSSSYSIFSKFLNLGLYAAKRYVQSPPILFHSDPTAKRRGALGGTL